MSPAPSQQQGFKWWLALLPIAFLTVAVWWALHRRSAQQEPVSAEEQAFNVQEVPKSEPQALPSAAAASAPRAPSADVTGPGLAGFVPEHDRMFYQDPAAKKDEELEREQEFLRKYGPAIDAETAKLSVITRRYYKRDPVVREVDRAFGSMPRYMALREQYMRDHNPYAFVRGAVALPEVRKTIYKFALNIDVWKATLGMVSEGLKQKPPPPVYDECKRFMTENNDVAKFMTDLTGYMTPRMGRILPQVIKPGQDLTPLTSLAKDLNVSGNMTDLSQAKSAVGNAQQQSGQ